MLLGQRGARAAREPAAQGLDAGSAAAPPWPPSPVCSAIAIASSGVRVALSVPAALAAMLAFAIVTQREHTAAGEVLSALALSSLALPVALAAGASPAVGVTCAAVFSAAFVSGTLCVRAVIRASRRPPAAGTRAVAGSIATASIAVLWLLAAAGHAAAPAPWTALPVCGGGLLLVLIAPPARHLRTIGWLLVATTTITAAALIVTLR